MNFQIEGMELSFKRKLRGCPKIKLNSDKLVEWKFGQYGYTSIKDLEDYSYSFSRNNGRMAWNEYDETMTIKGNIEAGLKYLYDNDIMSKYDYSNGVITIKHSMATDKLEPSDVLLDKKGCRQFYNGITIFTVSYSFSVVQNMAVIDHETPIPLIAKNLAILHKKNLLSKAPKQEILRLFNISNIQGKDSPNFIKKLLHFRLTQAIYGSND
ncbi:MAG: hypothetical protein V3W20_14315 [Candidatus Neomarinimicrobiota bacterium]